PDGSIDPVALQQMQQSLIGDKQALWQQQIDQNRGIAEAEGNVASAWSAATTAAQGIRDAALFIDGALLTGGASAAAGGGIAGHLTGMTVGTYWSGLSGGITAASEAGSLDPHTFGSGAAHGMGIGLAASAGGTLFGLGAQAAGMNPTLSAVFLGGVISKAS